MISRRSLIRDGFLVATTSAWAPWAIAGTPGRDNKSPAQGTSRSWTISNGIVSRSLGFEPGAGLITQQLSDLSINTTFIAPAANRSSLGQEFSFLCNGVHCAGASPDFELVDAGQATMGNGDSLTVRLRHKNLSLEVSAVYRVYNGHPAVRKHLVMRNTGAETLHISHLNIESIAITLGPENQTTLLTQYGTIPREIFYTGRSEDAGLLLSNGVTGVGMAILSEVPGYMKRTEIGGWDDADRVRIGVLYDTDLMPFERTLAKGEEFVTAAVSLLSFRSNDGFHDSRWVIPTYTAQVLVRRVDAQGPPWIYNTWEPFERGINHATVMELIDAAGSMGIDIFTIDDGWQQDYGDNAVNLVSFPHGLKPIQDAVEAKGMRLGLWIPVAAIATASPDFRSHPEWAATDREGKLKTTSTMAGEMAVMCMASAFRDSVADRIIDAIDRFRLAYVKLDLTTIFNAYGEAPGCWAKGHFHANWVESLNMIYEGIAHMTSRIYRKHSEVLLDLTFELWGQKHVIDAGLLAAGDLDWMSNVDDTKPDSAGPRQARQLLYQRAASMPVESMLIGNIHAELPSIQEAFATAIGSAPLLLGDLRKLSTSDRRWYKEKIGWFKKMRGAAKISESFFPLGSWLQPSPAAWDGFARMARNGNGIIVLFRNQSQEPVATIKLPLMPPGRLSVRSVMTGKGQGVFEGSDWVRGVPIALADAQFVEVFEVVPAAVK
jgi:alpha-galactosidase